MNVIEYPPHTPELAPWNYHLFRSIIKKIGSKRLTSVAGVENNIGVLFHSKKKTLTTNPKVKKLVDCIASNGGRFD